MDARQPGTNGGLVTHLRLHSSASWADVRMLEVNGRWIASADAPDGPSLCCGGGQFEALWGALEPFEGAMDELLASVPVIETDRLAE